jgi:hypothetical protein
MVRLLVKFLAALEIMSLRLDEQESGTRDKTKDEGSENIYVTSFISLITVLSHRLFHFIKSSLCKSNTINEHAIEKIYKLPGRNAGE